MQLAVVDEALNARSCDVAMQGRGDHHERVGDDTGLREILHHTETDGTAVTMSEDVDCRRAEDLATQDDPVREGFRDARIDDVGIPPGIGTGPVMLGLDMRVDACPFREGGKLPRPGRVGETGPDAVNR